MKFVSHIMGPPSDDGNGATFNTQIVVASDSFPPITAFATLAYTDTPNQMNTKLVNAAKQAVKDTYGYTVLAGDTLVTFNKAT